MPGLKDLTNQRFGKLLVLKRDTSKKGGAAYWICQCDCGSPLISVRGQALREGKQDCGCGYKTRRQGTIDTTSLIGKRFGKLVVIERDFSKELGHGHQSYWVCQCDCGNTMSTTKNLLTSGKTQSCGCLRVEALINRNTKDLTNQVFGLLVAKENTFQKSNHNSYIWRCECKCGNKNYLISAENLLSGKINSCGCNHRSLGELKIIEILTKANIKFEEQKTFNDLRGKNNHYLRYDFALYDNNNKLYRLIEFDGEQHYNKTSSFYSEDGILRDQQKNEYAIKHNIPLVRIPYTELSNLNLSLLLSDEYLIK